MFFIVGLKTNYFVCLFIINIIIIIIINIIIITIINLASLSTMSCKQKAAGAFKKKIHIH